MISLKLIELILAITLIIKTILHAIIDLRYDRRPDIFKAFKGFRTYFLIYKDGVSKEWEWLNLLSTFYVYSI